MRPTALFRLYQGLSTLALPFVARHSVNKLRAAGVDIDRAHERLGHATAQRRAGALIWLHAASVGEANSVLPLMDHIATHHPQAVTLLTSGTATSAQAIAHRLPEGAVHQFAPLDGIGPIKRFLRAWRPDLCVLVESELWPTLLDHCARADIPIALLNARLSDSSAQGWKRFPGTAAYVLRGIQMVHCQDMRSRDHLRDMGLSMAHSGVNLKSIVARTPRDADAGDAVLSALNGRPLWVAASTHPGEEDLILAAHTRLLVDHPSLCLILVPRHPARGDAVAALIKTAGLSHARRSVGGLPEDDAQVYLADTVAETDVWYAISPIVFLGGSLTDAGGHTPFEPAALHSAILHGPHYANFAEIYAAFRMQDASVEVSDASALAYEVDDLLTHPSRAAQLAARARPLAKDGDEVLTELSAQLLSLIPDHYRYD